MTKEFDATSMTPAEAKAALLAEYPEGHTGPGKFEGDPLAALYYYDLSMNGAADETLYDGETPIDVFTVDAEDRAVWGFAPATTRVAWNEGDTGFVYFSELTEETYAELVADCSDRDDDDSE